MKRLSIMTTRTVPVSDSDASTSNTDKVMKTGMSVQFSQPEANLVVPPTESLSDLEKRSVWYTFKELQSMHKFDLDRVTQYHQQHADKMGHSRLSPLQRQPSKVDDDSFSWRGMEEAVSKSSNINRKKTNRPTRSDRVKDTVRQIVALHHECVAKGLPLVNDELCHGSQKCTLADRQRAMDWAAQDAKDVGIQDVVVQRLSDSLSPPSKVMGKLKSASPKRHIRKISNTFSKLSEELFHSSKGNAG
jgi:hypothetical protein